MQNIKFYIRGRKINFDLFVLALIFVIPFFNFGYFNVYKTKIKICVIIFVIFIILKFLDQIRLFKIHRIAVLLLSYLFVSMILLNFPTSAEYFLLILFGMFIMSVKYSEKQLKILSNLFIVIGAFFAISLIWQKYLPDTFYSVLKYLVSDDLYHQAIQYVQGGDYTGFVCESNMACFCIAPAASILFAQFFFRDTRKNALVRKLILFGVLYYAIFLSGRRAFMLSFPAILTCFTVYYLLKKKNALAKLGAVFLIVIIIFMLYFVLFQEIINVLSGGAGKGIELSKREVYWQLAFSMFVQHPLTGMGMRSYDFQYNLISGRGLTFAGAHNCYLQMLAEVGLIGAILFFGFVIFMLLKTVKLTSDCVRNRYDTIGSYTMMSAIMQCIFIIVVLLIS